jgi:hypothetical protein
MIQIYFQHFYDKDAPKSKLYSDQKKKMSQIEVEMQICPVETSFIKSNIKWLGILVECWPRLLAKKLHNNNIFQIDLKKKTAKKKELTK